MPQSASVIGVRRPLPLVDVAGVFWDSLWGAVGQYLAIDVGERAPEVVKAAVLLEYYHNIPDGDVLLVACEGVTRPGHTARARRTRPLKMERTLTLLCYQRMILSTSKVVPNRLSSFSWMAVALTMRAPLTKVPLVLARSQIIRFSPPSQRIRA